MNTKKEKKYNNNLSMQTDILWPENHAAHPMTMKMQYLKAISSSSYSHAKQLTKWNGIWCKYRFNNRDMTGYSLTDFQKFS